MESKKDFSCLHTRTSGALAHTCKNDKTAEFCNFAPLRPAPTHLDKNNMESKKDFSCLHTRTSGALAHTCKNDKTAEFCNFAPLRPAPTHLDKNLDSVKSSLCQQITLALMK